MGFNKFTRLVTPQADWSFHYQFILEPTARVPHRKDSTQKTACTSTWTVLWSHCFTVLLYSSATYRVGPIHLKQRRKNQGSPFFSSWFKVVLGRHHSIAKWWIKNITAQRVGITYHMLVETSGVKNKRVNTEERLHIPHFSLSTTYIQR